MLLGVVNTPSELPPPLLKGRGGEGDLEDGFSTTSLSCEGHNQSIDYDCKMEPDELECWDFR